MTPGLDNLFPVTLQVGYLPSCSGWDGKTDVAAQVVQMQSKRRRKTLAHELGHVLGLNHCEPGQCQPNNLMYTVKDKVVSDGTLLTTADCATIRPKAEELSSRYDHWNSVVGRVPNSDSISVSYPADYGGPVDTQICCQNGSQKAFDSAPMCVFGGGTVLPAGQCLECCLFAQTPPNVGLTPSGTCVGKVLPDASQCTTVCCNLDSAATLVEKYECYALGGKAVNRAFCGGPS